MEIKRNWSSFPFFSLAEEQRIYRIHANEKHPIWLGNEGLGRFDPPESCRQLYGACYFGLDLLTSFIEVFGRMRCVSESEVNRRSLSAIQPTLTLTIADTTDRTILGKFGLTAEISASSDYKESQHLSCQLFRAGFDGIKYRVRHDPRGELEAIAPFWNPR